MSIIKKYIASYILKENNQANKNISSLFLKSILVKDSEGYLLEESYIEEDHELDELVRTGNCEDEFFKQVYESILNNGFKYFARGTGRIVFTHIQAPNLIFKLVIPGEETDENISETAKEKAMMKTYPHLFGMLYNISGNIPKLFNNVFCEFKSILWDHFI